MVNNGVFKPHLIVDMSKSKTDYQNDPDVFRFFMQSEQGNLRMTGTYMIGTKALVSVRNAFRHRKEMSSEDLDFPT